MLRKVLLWLPVYMGVSLPVMSESVKEDNLHVRTWNQFAQNVLRFHRERSRDLDIEIKRQSGGYANLPDFYLLENHYHQERLLASIAWEKENPEQLHTIEAFVHDEQGRVIRDYSAAYLPNYHNAPTQTLISLHHYENGLHGFRSFDASGYRVIERCSGSYRGRDVDFILEEDEIADALDEAHFKRGIMLSEEYKKCFGDLPQEAGVYLVPQ